MAGDQHRKPLLSNGAVTPSLATIDDFAVFMKRLEAAFNDMCAKRNGSLRDIHAHGYGDIQAEWKYENGRFVLSHLSIGTKHKEQPAA